MDKSRSRGGHDQRKHRVKNLIKASPQPQGDARRVTIKRAEKERTIHTVELSNGKKPQERGAKAPIHPRSRPNGFGTAVGAPPPWR
jgi:hypothetical protein